MKNNSISDQSIALLQKVLDLRASNEKVIASNIANSETPGYAPSRLAFEDELRQAVGNNKESVVLKTTNNRHIAIGGQNIEGVQGRIFKEEDTTGIGDQNGVDLDHEMLALAKNELLYETAAQLLKKKLTLRKYIIQGGQ